MSKSFILADLYHKTMVKDISKSWHLQESIFLQCLHTSRVLKETELKTKRKKDMNELYYQVAPLSMTHSSLINLSANSKHNFCFHPFSSESHTIKDPGCIF